MPSTSTQLYTFVFVSPSTRTVWRFWARHRSPAAALRQLILPDHLCLLYVMSAGRLVTL